MEPIRERFIMYRNAFEVSVVENETNDKITGWSMLWERDEFIIGMIKKLVRNMNNYRGREIARMFTYCENKALKYLGNKVLEGGFICEYRDQRL